LSAADLRSGLAAALAALQAVRDDLDELNVYPVRDRDTGTNMTATLEAVVTGVDRTTAGGGMAATCEAIRRDSLRRARGNSGIILSQILHGLADGLSGAEEADGRRLAAALDAARDAAYAAVFEPVEGTILTVMTGAAGAAGSAAGGSPGDVLTAAAAGAREALGRTTALLPALADAGVVDAAGAGLAVILDALAAHVTGRAPEPAPWDRMPSPTAAPLGGATVLYEVVCLLDADRPAVDALRRVWARLGTSVVTTGGEHTWTCHVHTDAPDEAADAARRAGRALRLDVTPLAVDACPVAPAAQTAKPL
jgi:dihydroxyacetone kinase-like predicted kinase